MARPKLPSRLFIRWQQDGTSGHFLLPAETIGDLDVCEETVEVGVYELKKKVKVENTTAITS